MLENRTRLHVIREPKAPPLRLLFAYCRLLPPRQSAKLLEGNRVTGAGDGNRTHVRSLGSFHIAIVRRPLSTLAWKPYFTLMIIVRKPITTLLRFECGLRRHRPS